MAMNGNEGGSAYPPNPDVKSGSCLIAGFQPLTVFHPSYWNAYKAESGATFSIDMVRLKLSFINGKGEWLSTHAQTFDCDSMSAWTSKIRPGGWYELWSFELGDSSVALGIGFMEPSCKVNMNRGFIEFNPKLAPPSPPEPLPAAQLLLGRFQRERLGGLVVERLSALHGLGAVGHGLHELGYLLVLLGELPD